jgi:predicted nucleotidyltransferase
MEEILPVVIVEIIADAQKVFKAAGVDYFIVGAIARDIHLAKLPGGKYSRKTLDVDFAVFVRDEYVFKKIKEDLVATGKFTVDDRNAIKLWYNKGIEIDLMPFGGIENEQREVRLLHPKLFTMDMPGFKEVYGSLENVSLNNENFMACSVEGLILLKLYAWDSRPERNKDLQDIDLLLLRYIDICSTVYENYFDVLELYDEKEQHNLTTVSGRVVGREMAKLLGYDAEKINQLKGIILKRPVIGWIEMADGLEDN